MTYRLRHLWLTAAAILALASCSQDDTGEGGSPYDGDSPVVFSATGITPLGTTRATVDGTWEGTEKVTVKVNGVEKTYVVKASSADKKSATLEADTGVEPFKWSEVEGKAVEAYTTENVLDNQSELADYRASDWLHASVNNMTRTSVLNFEHQVARLVITVGSGDFAKDKVELVVGSQTITPYRDEDNSRYLAIVKSGSISISVKIHHGGKDYIYTHAGTHDLKGGESYAVNVKIDKTMHITDEATLKAWAEAVKKDPTVSAIVDNDFSMSSPADGASNWEPIAEFKGTFDGNGHTISGIVVNKTNSTGFIVSNHGTVKNLTLEDAKITGSSNVGAVAGENWSTIENCHVTGASKITGSNAIGGVVGLNNAVNGVTILACHVAKECKVSGSQSMVGGIVGLSIGGQITGCYALCSLEGFDMIGGICGNLSNTSLTACYSKCSYIPGYSDVGGIAGYNASGANFSTCYWQGDTNCTKGVGNAATDPSGVNKITWDHSFALLLACSDMNNELEGYEYFTNDDFSTFTDEPLVLKKKQQ